MTTTNTSIPAVHSGPSPHTFKVLSTQIESACKDLRRCITEESSSTEPSNMARQRATTLIELLNIYVGDPHMAKARHEPPIRLRDALASGSVERIIAAMSPEHADALLSVYSPGGELITWACDDLMDSLLTRRSNGALAPTILGSEIAHRIVELTSAGKSPWLP